jgi:hypothetical protein
LEWISKMYSADDYLLSGIGITLIAFIFGRCVGVLVGVSLGMLMVFYAFLSIINWGGNSPSTQPWQESYAPSNSERNRLWDKMPDDLSGMSQQDWGDYHRCKDHNVCVRRFAH